MRRSSAVIPHQAGNSTLWLKCKEEEGKKVKDGDMPVFRIGSEKEKYPISTPTAEQYENNWKFST